MHSQQCKNGRRRTLTFLICVAFHISCTVLTCCACCPFLCAAGCPPLCAPRPTGAPDLPVFYVELAACTSYDGASYSFPLLRQAQRAVLSLPNTGFITAIDVGGNHGSVHSPVKVPDGQRMALQLRAKVYGEHGLVADGPVLATAPLLSSSGATVVSPVEHERHFFVRVPPTIPSSSVTNASFVYLFICVLFIYAFSAGPYFCKRLWPSRQQCQWCDEWVQ